jgi:hypothetical protein
MNAIPAILARARRTRLRIDGLLALGALASSGLLVVVLGTLLLAPAWAPVPIMALGVAIYVTALAWLCSDCHEGERG